MSAEHIVKLLKTLQVNVENRHICPHADCNLAGVHADGAAAQDDNVSLRGSGNTGKKDSLTAELLLEVFCAFLNRKTAGNLGHRCKKRKRTVSLLQRFVGNRLHIALKKRIRLLLISCQMQVCIQNQSVMKQRIFFLQRLLNLDHHIHKVPHILRVVDQGSSGIHILIVRKARTDTGALLHVYMVACGNIGLYVIRCKPHAEFVVFDFFHATDFHTSCPPFQYSYSPKFRLTLP